MIYKLIGCVDKTKSPELFEVVNDETTTFDKKVEILKSCKTDIDVEKGYFCDFQNQDGDYYIADYFLKKKNRGKRFYLWKRLEIDFIFDTGKIICGEYCYRTSVSVNDYHVWYVGYRIRRLSRTRWGYIKTFTKYHNEGLVTQVIFSGKELSDLYQKVIKAYIEKPLFDDKNNFVRLKGKQVLIDPR